MSWYDSSMAELLEGRMDQVETYIHEETDMDDLEALVNEMLQIPEDDETGELDFLDKEEERLEDFGTFFAERRSWKVRNKLKYPSLLVTGLARSVPKLRKTQLRRFLLLAGSVFETLKRMRVRAKREESLVVRDELMEALGLTEKLNEVAVEDRENKKGELEIIRKFMVATASAIEVIYKVNIRGTGLEEIFEEEKQEIIEMVDEYDAMLASENLQSLRNRAKVVLTNYKNEKTSVAFGQTFKQSVDRVLEAVLRA
jgi:hypothetical protein